MMKLSFETFRQAQFEGTVAALDQLWQVASLARRADMMVEKYWAEKRAASPNPLVRAGQKYYSQSDEDGITLEILRRLGKAAGVFAEFGCGTGLENNSLILLMSGWRGAWIGGEALQLTIPAGSEKLRFVKDWVTAENCAELAARGLPAGGLAGVDLLSVDLDGNDLHITEALLRAGAKPAVLVAEYNGKFPPPIRFTVKYDPQHRWKNDDYQGASLQSYLDLLEPAGYRLVACNLTGTNAFFVRREFDAHFQDVPADPAALFYPADYNWFFTRGHPAAARTIEQFL
jgi:hypothetical protein